MNIKELIERVGNFAPKEVERDVEEALLAQQAVIEQKHNALLDFCPSPSKDAWFKRHLAARNAKADLSALREHDAEVIRSVVKRFVMEPSTQANAIYDYAERIRKGEH